MVKFRLFILTTVLFIGAIAAKALAHPDTQVLQNKCNEAALLGSEKGEFKFRNLSNGQETNDFAASNLIIGAAKAFNEKEILMAARNIWKITRLEFNHQDKTGRLSLLSLYGNKELEEVLGTTTEIQGPADAFVCMGSKVGKNAFFWRKCEYKRKCQLVLIIRTRDGSTIGPTFNRPF